MHSFKNSLLSIAFLMISSSAFAEQLPDHVPLFDGFNLGGPSSLTVLAPFRTALGGITFVQGGQVTPIGSVDTNRPWCSLKLYRQDGSLVENGKRIPRDAKFSVGRLTSETYAKMGIIRLFGVLRVSGMTSDTPWIKMNCQSTYVINIGEFRAIWGDLMDLDLPYED